MCGPSASWRPEANQQQSRKVLVQPHHFEARGAEALGGEGLTQFTPGTHWSKCPLGFPASTALSCPSLLRASGTNIIHGSCSHHAPAVLDNPAPTSCDLGSLSWMEPSLPGLFIATQLAPKPTRANACPLLGSVLCYQEISSIHEHPLRTLAPTSLRE